MSLTVPPGQYRRPGARGVGQPLRGTARRTPAGSGAPPAAVGHARCRRSTECIATRDARHAYAVLRGLTSSSGGMVAAATTSLPERAEAGRNYDYRYAWIRDQCYAGQAAAAAGAYPLLDNAVRFVSAPAARRRRRACAGLHRGRRPRCPDQRQLDLPGYPGGFDLVGNWVNKQFQLDALGESLLLLAAAARLRPARFRRLARGRDRRRRDRAALAGSTTPGSGRSTTRPGRTAG